MFRIRFTNSAEADLLELWLTLDGLRSFHTRTSYIIFYIEITDHIQDCAESIYPPFFTHRPARAVTHKARRC